MDVKLISLAKLDIVTSKSTQPAEPILKKETAPEVKASRKAEPESAINTNKAVFAIQDDKYIVIQFLDKEGQVVKQIPAKELISAYERLQESVKSSYDREA